MSRQWFPMYPGDYLRDTAHLTTSEHGAYLLLLIAYYANGGLPVNNEELRAITKSSYQWWSQHAKTVLAFFEPHTMHHKRCDQELRRSMQVAAANSTKARRAADARWSSKHAPSNGGGNASSMRGASKRHASSILQASLGDAPGMLTTKKERKTSFGTTSEQIASDAPSNAGSLACAPDGALREPADAVPQPVPAKPGSLSPSEELVRRELGRRLGRSATDTELADYLAARAARG